MTPAEHAALSAQLARAIGWADVIVGLAQDPDGCFVAIPNYGWWPFDYRDPSVAMGVLQRFGVHHALNVYAAIEGGWRWSTAEGYDGKCDTLHEAIASAAIAVADAKRQQVEQNEAREVLQA